MLLGEVDQAIEALEPIAEDINANFLLSMLYLSNGDYERGFRLYRLRGQSMFAPPLYELPRTFDHWSEVENKTVAVLQEGGFGDAIQFCRYLPLLAEKARQITYFVPANLLRLFAQLPVQVAPNGYHESRFDLSTTDAEMPYHFRTTLETIPNALPYLHVPKELIQARLLPKTSKRRVGLCWAGGTGDARYPRPYDERRSFSLSQYAPLAGVADVEFVSLQLGQRVDEVCAALPVTRVLDSSFDILDTAAVIMQLDLVISVDTMIAHLTAALGKPVWVLTRLDVDWRWLRNRHPNSPWYPDVLRIIAQTEYRKWEQPVAEAARMLREEFPLLDL
jgi:hypothetical protein